MIIIRFTAFLSIILISVLVYGQSYYLGLNPSTLKWRSIKTDKVEVIFPESVEKQAQRVANLAVFLYDSSFYSIGNKKEKVSIILQNQTTTSNGFVDFGPFRSELFLNAPQNSFLGSVNWIDLLTIHEYRHVEQFVNAKNGVSKLGSIFYGQYGWGTFAGLALPRWFFEGDAVFYETALTTAGRGRMPVFEGEYRALFLDGRNFGYEKASAGSYKEYIPSHYHLGYHLVTSLRRKYGRDAWEDVLVDATRYKGVLFPFSRSIKKKTGLNTPKFYTGTMSELKTDWEEKESKLALTQSSKVNQRKKTKFASYRNAKFVDNETIVVDKTGFEQIPTYTLLTLNGEENRITSPGIYSGSNATLSVSQNKIVWAENSFDTRWGYRDYSDILIADLNGKKKKLTQFKKYFTPSLSPEGNKIVALHVPETQEIEIHILDNKGNILKTISDDSGHQFSFPVWMDNKYIGVIAKKNNQNAIGRIDAESGSFELISPYWDKLITFLTFKNGFFYITGIFSGIENIYAYNPSTSKLYQVTSTLFGATQPDVSPDGKALIFSEYSRNGYDIKLSEINQEEWIQMANLVYTPVDYYKTAVGQDYTVLEDISMQTYESEAYKKTDLPKLHSWSPWYFPDLNLKKNYVIPGYGLQLYAKNLMGTLAASGNYSYNLNENRSSWGVTMNYAQLFPVINFGYTRSDRNRYLKTYFERKVDGKNEPVLDTKFDHEWMEDNINIGFTLPFNLTAGNYFTQFWLTNSYNQKWVDYDNDEYANDQYFGTYDLELNFYSLRRRAYQHMNPRLGIFLNIKYEKTINTTWNNSYSFNFNSIYFLPGIKRNHSFYTNIDYHAEPWYAQFKFIDNASYTRGYGSFIHDDFTRIGFNYKFPLLYPDLPLGPLAFIKRVKTNLFFDYGIAKTNTTNINEFHPTTRVTISGRYPANSSVYRSFGSELTFDFRLFRSLEVDMGIRYSYLLDVFSKSDRNQFELMIVSIGL